VFAPWREVYYTATVTDTWKDKTVISCRVQFDDKTWADIPLKSLYRCELHEGDKIKVPGLKGKKLGRDGYVSAVPLWEDRHRVSVRLVTIPQEEVAIFDGKKIAVVADFVRKEWEDRKAMTLEDIGLGKELIRAQEEKERKEAEAKAMGRTIPSAAFLGPPRWKDSPPPPPRHASLPSRGRKRPPPATDSEVPATSHKRRRLAVPSTNNASSDLPFTNHLIIHALAVNDDKGNPLEKDQRGVQKKELTANIERLGGKVINGFGELLQWGGALSDDGDRWVWEAGDIQEVKDEPSPPATKKRRGAGTTTSPEPPRIFLVADGPNRNTKYLMALAAGIPCVDQGWVYDEAS
jgi:BRCA1 C Terminus (BRCT) domain